MDLSVIVPCYNAADTLAEQLEALTRQQWPLPWEVILVNNRCTDDSMKVAERYRDRLPHFRIVDALARQGRPHALNVGAAAARGESLVFCDADDVVADGWLAALGHALREHDFVASRFDGTRLNPPWLQHVRKLGQDESLTPIWYPPYLLHAGCCGLGVKRSIHEKAGGFDESFPCLQETDYCFRVQLAGVKLHFVREAVVHVRLRPHLWGTFTQARTWAKYNVVLYKKYQPVVKQPARHPWRTYLSDWSRLFLRALTIRGRGSVGACVWMLGWQLGRLSGSIECGVPPV